MGEGNIGVHSRKEGRFICHVCGKTFSATKATVFYRLRTSVELVTQVVTLLAYGCPVAAQVAAFGLDERTGYAWQRRAGKHCRAVHEHLVEQPHDLGQVQADEIRVKHQGGVAWLAMALQAPTRLWLGGVVSVCRNGVLIERLMGQVRCCALYRPLLLCVDGPAASVSAVKQVFRTPVFSGKRGRPRLRAWDNRCVVQVVKQVAAKRVVGVVRRLVMGTETQAQMLLRKTQNTLTAHVAYIERLNGAFRARISALVRRGRTLARQVATLEDAMFLLGCVYNFCDPHTSLRRVLYLPDNSRRWAPMTPAMQAGITNHVWRLDQLLGYQVPLSRWEPPKHRGKRSKKVQQLINQWLK
jgi:hypothetical protein